MTNTANIAVTLVEASQAQKEVTVNQALSVFDAAFSEIGISMSDANYTLGTTGTPKEWQYGTIKLTGTLTASRNVIAPTNKKTYKVVNGTTGGFSVVFKTASGSGVTVTAGVTAIVRCDGTDVVAITSGSGAGTVSSVSITSPAAGITFTGTITTSGSITAALADDLAALEALSSTGIIERTGTNTYALRTLDTDGAMAANSTTRIPSQSAVVTYVDSRITGGASDVMIFKGVIDCSGNPNYPAADAGNLYKVSVAGKIGGASGPNVEVGDTIYCTADSTASGNHATVGSSWAISQVNLDGAVIGPSSATDNYLCLFDGTTGKLIKAISLSAVLDQLSSTQGAVLYRGASGWAALGPGTAGQALVTGGAAANPAWTSQPFDVTAFYPGVPAASVIVTRIPVARAITFPANFTGSKFAASANAAADTVFDVQKNGSSIGSITIGAGGTTATFATTGGSAQSFAAGDVLQIVAPGSPDATLANPGFALAAAR